MASVGPILSERLRTNATEPITSHLAAVLHESLRAQRTQLLNEVAKAIERAYLEGLRDGFVQHELQSAQLELTDQPGPPSPSAPRQDSGERPDPDAIAEAQYKDRLPASIAAGQEPTPGGATADQLRRIERARAEAPERVQAALAGRTLRQLSQEEAEEVLATLRAQKG